MRCIKVYKNENSDDHVEVPLHHQFYFYHYIPYVLMSDLTNVNINAMGLFLLNEQGRKFTHSRYNERIYLNQYDNIPVEDGYYILNCSSGRKEEFKVDQIGCNRIDINSIRNPAVSLGGDSNVCSSDIGEEKYLGHARKRTIAKN
ncbi:unnamed protein product [Rotaria magnacalcarata]|uniref:Uncharacterized protein n=1 Tax=Rotaria magnacalcarata TaxID=392030 RepID=A0A816TIE2_9BILA|nr:unnamed protein product [Rotaria magnacalcarata]CAF1617372.1 unnamed protein product [Rotaria magnacalcarata]CAF2033904.1 unnamed protein product [Rotaria magnacalcarata]CAF2092405.1 unnamed protein product [Rotaria magnacalcarata]CAF2133676.1 unnamed protein product [Rotaria magnacalcarata]